MSNEFRPDSERYALAAFLDVQRSALVRRAEGLSEVDARRVPTASALSLLSLLKHSAIWEERWFQGVRDNRLPTGGRSRSRTSLTRTSC